MSPPVVIRLGAGSVDVEVVSVSMFEGRELADLLSFWEWSQDMCDDSMGVTCEAFQVAEPI